MGAVASVIDAMSRRTMSDVNLAQAESLAMTEYELNKRLSEQEFQYNRTLAEEEYNRNIEQWQRENEYNLPANQMLRYQEAGLNPNLVTGQQNLSVSSPTYRSPQYNAPNAPHVNIPFNDGSFKPFNILEDIMNLATFKDRMRILDAQATQEENKAVSAGFDTNMKGILSNSYAAMVEARLQGLLSGNRKNNLMSDWLEFKNNNKDLYLELDRINRDLKKEQFNALREENKVTNKLGFNPYKGGWQAWIAQTAGNAISNGSGVLGWLLNSLK